MRRRTRRSRVTWLPNIPFESDVGEPLNIISDGFEVFADGKTNTHVYPLVKDEDPDPTGLSLADYSQGGYLLKRVVGKLFCGMRQAVPNEGRILVPNTLVIASLEVLRTDSTNNPAGVVNADVNYNALISGNERDPWIWQRSWALANYNSGYVAGNGPADTWSNFPQNNPEYGSVMDGPHVDAKTARRIGADERLYLCVTTTCVADYTAAIPTIDDGAMDFIFQYRVLGVPIRTSNRRNASR